MATRELKVEIIGDSRSLERALGRSGAAAHGFGSRMSRMGVAVGKAALVAGAAVTTGFVVALKRGFDELAEGQKVAAQTAAVIKSTGGVANVTAEQVEDLATAQSRLTGIDDELIQASENLLLTFKNVRNEVGKGNDVFDRATKAALDLSTAGFGSVESASKMMGKALNDPIKGMTALGRAGVTFSEDQKKAIKALVESGHALDAQKLILKEVESQVGGSAKAYGETLPGQLSKLRNSFDEVAGELAVKFLPGMIAVLDWVNANWPTISRIIDTAGTVVISVFGAIRTASEFLRGQWERHRETVRAVWTGIQNAVSQTVEWFRVNVVPAIQNVAAAAQAIWDRFGGAIMAITRTTFGTLVTVVRTLMQNIKSAIEIVLALIRGDWSKAWEELKAIVSRSLAAAWAVLKGSVTVALTAARAIGAAILDGIAAGLKGIGQKLAEAMQAIWNQLTTAATTAYNAAVRIGSQVVTGIWDGFKEKIGWLKDQISGAIGGILSKIDIPGFSPPEAAGAAAIGRPIAEGILVGFLEGTAELPAKMGERLRNSLTAAKTAIDAQRATLSEAFRSMAEDAMRAFDAETQAGLDRIQKNLDAKLRQIGADLSAAMAKVEKGRAAETPAEKALRMAEEGIAAENRQKALEQARAGGDPEAILAAEREIALAALRKQAEDERSERDRIAAEKVARLEREAEKDRKREETQAARRALNYSAEREQRRAALERYLQMVEEELAKEPKKWDKRHREIMAKFKGAFGPDYEKAGFNLGIAFGRGLSEAMGEVEKTAERLARMIADYLKTSSPTKKGPMSSLNRWWDGFVPALLSGFDDRALRTFLSSATSPDVAFAAAGGVGGSMALAPGSLSPVNVTVHVAGSVLSERDLIDVVRRGIIQEGKRSGSNLFGGYA